MKRQNQCSQQILLNSAEFFLLSVFGGLLLLECTVIPDEPGEGMMRWDSNKNTLDAFENMQSCNWERDNA